MIKVIATGGTITNSPAGRLAADEAVAQLPQVAAIAEIRVDEVHRVASSALGIDDMVGISNAVNRTFADEPNVEGIVITVGSNQSEDLAYYLNLTVSSSKPVVVTAAQRRRGTLSEDASRNFVDAVVTATSQDSANKGVVLVANELIHPAREVTKNVVSRVDSWQSPDTGALGIVSGGEAIFYRAPLRRHTMDSEFSGKRVTSASELPKVEIIYSYADADPVIVDAAVQQAGARGLVVAAFATGAPHTGQATALVSAVEEHGVTVAISNRGSSGRIPPDCHPFVGADNLRPQKAMILLKLALSLTDDASEVQRIFNEY